MLYSLSLNAVRLTDSEYRSISRANGVMAKHLMGNRCSRDPKATEPIENRVAVVSQLQILHDAVVDGDGV